MSKISLGDRRLLTIFAALMLALASNAQRFDVSEAQLSDGLVLKNELEGATVHKWNSTTQTMTWQSCLKAGRYEVRLRYSEPYRGCAVKVSVDGREVVSMLKTTDRWGKYRTSRIGVISVGRDGDYTVILGGIQNSLRQPTVAEMESGKNGAAEPKHEEAMPDVAWIELLPTTIAATDAPSGISREFRGHPLFDGKTLNGWEPNSEGTGQWFHVEDESIVAGSLMKNAPRNEFLRTKRKYSDFELRLKFKIVDPAGRGWNGGVQFRSVPNPDVPYEMIGYQADIIKKRWGALYDEQRRWCFLGSILSEQDCRWNEWNEYIIRAEGPRIRIWLNGKPVVDYVEPYAFTKHPRFGIIPNKGYIALQIHERKNPYEIWYKDISIEELKMPAALQEQFLGAEQTVCTTKGLLAPGVPEAERLGWQVGVQAYDFKRTSTFFDAVRLTAALGLHCIEGVGMPLAPGTNIQFGPDMPPEWRDSLRQVLTDNDVTLTSYYRRVNGRNDPTGTERVFAFCRDMGMMLVTDPVRVPSGNGSMDYYEQLAEKYGVRVVLTNHPESDGSPYFSPDTVLSDLAGRSPLLGASVDVGHFMRDGREPLEIVRKYVEAGRMYHFHLRDVNGFGKAAQDVPVGQGAGHLREIFDLLRSSGVKPIMTLEYERDMYNPLFDLIPAVYGIDKCLK